VADCHVDSTNSLEWYRQLPEIELEICLGGSLRCAVMRLAHLHIKGLTPYSHSLRLQKAILDRHFRHKDLLRTSGRTGHESAAAEPGDTRNEGRSNAYAYAHSGTNDVGGRSKPQLANEPNTEPSRKSDVQTPDEANAASKLDRLRSPSLENGNTSWNTQLRSKPPHQNPAWKHRLNDYAHAPDPVLLTFSTPPTYTVGRRHLLANPISLDQQAFLFANGLATFHASPRGGLLTYHAPGQVTGYVIADLRRHGITARCWVKLLEESVMRTCAAWGVTTGRTSDPGVWVFDAAADESRPGDHLVNNPKPKFERDARPSDRKICAIGVQVSRGITSHGVGLNVHDAPLPSSSMLHPTESHDFKFAPAQLSSPSYDAASRGYLSWGFSRIVACGLEGKSVSWLTREIDPAKAVSSPTASTTPQSQPTEDTVAAVLAREVMCGLNTMKGTDKEAVDDIYHIQESDVLG
jgi:lipoate-protein ligase B